MRVSLNWKSCNVHQRDWRKHKCLSTAHVLSTRFLLREHWMPEASGGIYYKLHDAHLVTDAEVRAGKYAPEIVWSRDVDALVREARRIRVAEYLERRSIRRAAA